MKTYFSPKRPEAQKNEKKMFNKSQKTKKYKKQQNSIEHKSRILKHKNLKTRITINKILSFLDKVTQ